MESWSIVSCFININDGMAKSKQFYYEKGKFLFSINANIIFFTDRENYEFLYNLRKELGYINKTKFILISLEEFPYYSYLNKITDNRKNNPWYGSWNRNTPKYFILVASKLEMLKRSVDSNPFGSTHFIWIDFGIHYLKHVKSGMIENIIKTKRDKFSMCYIEYQPKNFIKDYSNFYQMGQRGTAGGVLSGNIEHIRLVYNIYDPKVREVIEKGYGHGEEQIIVELEKDRPDLFDFYYGTYDSILANWIYIKEDIDSILENFISKARYDGNHSYTYKCCNKIKESITNGLVLSAFQYIKYVDEFYIASWYLNDKNNCVILIKDLQDKMKNNKELIEIYNNRLDHYISNFDFILEELPEKEYICIKDKQFDLNKLDVNKYKIFFYYDNCNITESSLITSNPVIRPLKFYKNIKYKMMY